MFIATSIEIMETRDIPMAVLKAKLKDICPERINVSFAEILNKKNIKINVWERGAGQTKACGTAACAVAIAAFKKALVDKNLQINFKEGNLQIDCENEIFMTGPVSDAVKIKLDI